MLDERQHVVPVAADLGALDAGLVAGGGGRGPSRWGSELRHEAALQLLRDRALRVVERRVLLRHLLEAGGQLLGTFAPPDEAFGEERGDRR